MDVPHKNRWKVTASSGDPRRAIDDNYATTWLSEPSKKTWLEIDLGEVATLGGLEVYWGKQAAGIYGFEFSQMEKPGRIFVALAMARVGRTSLRSPRPRHASCAGFYGNPEPERGRRLSKSTFMVPPRRRRCWKRVVSRRSGELREKIPSR